MKKLLLVFLILVPLLIVAATALSVQLISQAIDIPAKSVTIDIGEEKNVKNMVVATGDTLQLNYRILPTKTTNQRVLFESSDDLLATVTTDGFVSFLREGEVTISVTWANSALITAGCRFYIYSDSVSSVEISCDKSELLIGEKSRLAAVVLPLEAENKSVLWTSDNADVLTVDANGVVTPKAAGNSTVTVTTLDGSFTDSVNLSVKAPIGPLLYDEITISDTGFDLNRCLNIAPSDRESYPFTVIGSATLSEELMLTITSAAATDIAVNVFDGITNSVLTIHYVTTPNVVIKGKALLPKTLSVKGEIITLIPVYDAFDGGYAANCTFASSDENVATISQNGVITALHSGEVTFSVLSGNEICDSITVEIEMPLSYMALSYDNEKDKECGIGMKHVYGVKTFVGETLDTEFNTIDILKDVTVFPADGSKEFRITLSNDDVADIIDDKLILKAAGKVTVTVAAVYNMYSSISVSDTYLLEVVDGIDIFTAEQAVHASDQILGMVLQADILLERKAPTYYYQRTQFLISSNMWGNGYTISAENVDKTWLNNKSDDSYLFHIDTNNVTVDNVFFKGYENNGNLGEFTRGNVLAIHAGGNDRSVSAQSRGAVENVTVRNCYIFNGRYAIRIYSASTRIEGCIIENTLGEGILISRWNNVTPIEFETTVTIKDAIFNNTFSSAIIVNCDDPAKTAYPNNLIIEGSLEIYNWRSAEDAELMKRIQQADGSAFDIFSIFMTQLNNGTFDHLAYVDEAGKTYYHIGITYSDYITSKNPSTFNAENMDNSQLLHQEFLSLLDFNDYSVGVTMYSYSAEDAPIKPSDVFILDYNTKLRISQRDDA